MEWWEEFFNWDGWQLVWSAVISAIVASAVTFWLRYRDKPTPDWLFRRLTLLNRFGAREMLELAGTTENPDFMINAINVGDGPAYQLSVRSDSATVKFFIKTPSDARGYEFPGTISRVKPEAEISILIWFHPDQDFDTISFEMEWLHSPIRHLNYGRTTVHLANYERIRRRRLRSKLAAWFRGIPKSLKGIVSRRKK